MDKGEESSVLMSQSEVMRYIGVSASKFNEIRQIDGFPKPVRPAMNRNMYYRKEVEEWVQGLPRVTDG